LDLIIQQRDSLHVEQKRQMDLNSILNQVTLSYDSTQNNLLFQLTKYVNNSNLELREFMAPHIFYTNSEKIQTVKVTMAGNYNDISEFIFDVEMSCSLVDPHTIR
jgi:Tfp pilus assembly protein PilO